MNRRAPLLAGRRAPRVPRPLLQAMLPLESRAGNKLCNDSVGDLKGGVDVDRLLPSGHTRLATAAFEGCAKAATLLLQHGAGVQ